MSEQNGRAAEILRLAGHPQAAEIVERLDAFDKQAGDEADQPRPAPDPQRQLDAAEAARQHEAQVMLRALRASGVVD